MLLFFSQSYCLSGDIFVCLLVYLLVLVMFGSTPAVRAVMLGAGVLSCWGDGGGRSGGLGHGGGGGDDTQVKY